MKIRFSVFICLCGLVMLTTSASFSLSNYLQSENPRRENRPDNCLVWTREQCDKCNAGYIVNSQGFCQEELQILGDGQVLADEQFGQIVDDNFIPCRGQSNCADSLAFSSNDQFSKFISQYQQQDAPRQQLLIKDSVALPMARSGNTIESASFSKMAFQTAEVQANRDFSGTNNQEQNVDEADILKTDGTYIYTISNGILSITQAYPASSIRVLSTVSLNDLRPSAIFIDGNYLAIFGTKYQQNYPVYQTKMLYRPYINPSKPQTFIKIYDVSNRARPQQIKSYEVQGSYFNGRKTEDGFVYLLTTTQIYQRSYVMPWYNFGNKQLYFPFRNIFYYPGKYSSPVFLSIFTFNLAKPLRNQRGLSCLIIERAQTIYMSEKAIYISYTDYASGSDYSVIHKVYVRRNRIIPFADARIRGRINNQFSMDEYYQVLRVATTSNQAGTTSNNVYCLDFFLHQIGWLKGIAKGETIFSARFVDRRLYMVTFRQVDPFFVISFRSHRVPQILGELKITGFSRYLHPYDENTIIGLGRQADLNGRQQGLKISLFDVSNVKNPRETDSFELQQKYAASSAQWEHKAFLFSKAKNLMAIPGSMSYNDVKFNGAFVFYIDSSRIKLKGIVDHLTSDKDAFYKRNVQRSFYIEELLYTKSQCLLRVNRIDNLKDVKDVSIPCEKDEIIKPTPIPEPVPVPLPQPIPIQPWPVQPIYPIDPIVIEPRIQYGYPVWRRNLPTSYRYRY